MNATTSPFVAARQAAWDKYRESVTRRSLYTPPDGGSRHEGFTEGYNLGALEGIKHARSQIAPALARNTDPENSHDAAAAVKVKAIIDAITRSLRNEGPGTAHEIAKRIGLPLNTVSPRFATMKRNGICHVAHGIRVGRSHRSVYAIGNGVSLA